MGLAAAATVVSHALARSAYAVLLPAIEADLLGSHQEAGALSTVNFAAYLVGVALFTAIGGRVEPARLTLGGLALASVGFGVLATADGFATLALGQALTGMAGAAIWMSVPAIATGAVGPDQRGTAMGALASSMGLGIVAVSQGTNLVRAWQGDEGAWRPIWLGAALFSLAVLVVTALVLRTPPTMAVSGGVGLARLRTVPGWLALTGAYWLSGLVLSSFTSFLGAALEADGIERDHVSNLYALIGLAAALGTVGFGRLSDRIGRRPVLMGAALAMAAASLLVLTGREPWAALAAVLFGLSSFTFPVLVAAVLSDHLEGRAFANALGALTLAYGTALAVAPLVAGTIGDSRYGFDLLFSLVAACAVATAALISRLAPDRRPDPVPVG